MHTTHKYKDTDTYPLTYTEKQDTRKRARYTDTPWKGGHGDRDMLTEVHRGEVQAHAHQREGARGAHLHLQLEIVLY